MKCLICGLNNLKLKYKLQIGEIYTCNHCTCEFMHPQPNNDRLQEIYSKDYYSSWGLSEKAHNVTREMKYTHYI